MDFKSYQTHKEAAAEGCWACGTPLDPSTAFETGYPKGRGNYAFARCPKCQVRKYYNLAGEFKLCSETDALLNPTKGTE